MTAVDPTLRTERMLFREGATLVVGCDEVGRGAIAGPVAVGLAVCVSNVRGFPLGLRDSKLLSEKRREQIHPEIDAWASFSAVGFADNTEVDSLGIVPALRIAALRAFETLSIQGVPVETAVVLLDGSHDWLTRALAERGGLLRPRVVTRVGADRDCATVAAASVLAKVRRDRFMIDAATAHPGYDWASNKGYASARHYAALERLGVSPLHRWSWLKERSRP